MTGYESKKAMAQAKTIDEVNWADHEPDNRRASAQDKLAQPAQEPVAWLTRDSVDGCWYATANKVGNDDKPLYTTLPQRPWVEPTESEWFNWWRVSQVADATEAEIDFADFLIIAQAVAAKLKEKNNG